MLEQEIFKNNNGVMPASLNDRHLACVLLLDTSSSMEEGNAIGLLNSAVGIFQNQCKEDDALRRGLDISVVTFDSQVKVVQDFVPISHMEVPQLRTNGSTSMGAGLTKAMELIEARKAQYKELGVPYHRPWIFMITDGEPNDDYVRAFDHIQQMQEMRKVEIWAVGVPGYDKKILTSLTERVIELTDTLNFAGLFEWLSNSLSVKASSQPTDSVQYEVLPEGSRVVPNSWGKA